MTKEKGIFIALDGIDGSGKATQAKFLAARIRKQGRRVHVIDFPQYGEKSAGPIEEYLNGKYGSASEVGPKVTSYFFAIDRYDASFKIRKLLERGDVVIADRYIGGNIGHQGGKFSDSRTKWRRYVQWVEQLEYKTFGIPRPNLYFIFMIPPQLSKRSSGHSSDPKKIKKRKAYLGEKHQDIHERDTAHLTGAFQSYERLLKEYPRQFTRVRCAPEGTFRPMQEIHEEIWKKVSVLLH